MDKLTKYVLIVISIITVAIISLVIIIKVVKSNNYDISMMKEVSVEDIIDMFNDNKTYVVMMGAESCDVCVRLLPKMAEAQKELNYTTQYIDLFSIDFNSNAWKELKTKLDMKSTQAISEDNNGEKITETYGYFIENYMMAPTVFIIKEGKQVAGFIGGVKQDDLIPWIKIRMS